MAAISSIANGEAMSSVRTKLNSVITNVNLLDPTDWVDYSATSTIVGWSSFTTKKIRYRIIGKQMFVQIQLDGTSNSVSTSFTLPNSANNINSYNNSYFVDNGVAYLGTFIINSASTTVTCYRWSAITTITGSWTNSGSKSIFGQFFIEIA